MTTVKSIRWGVFGTGKMARQFCGDLRLLPRAEITAVGSRSQERATQFADQYDIPVAAKSYEAVAQNEDVDIVYVATPQSRHYDDVRMALEAGKHVLCEKPLTINATLSSKLAKYAKEENRFLMEALWTRFLPFFGRMREILQDDLTGTPQLLLADIGAYVPFDPEHRMYNASLGGGALLDLGIYPIQLALQLFGKPQHVFSTASIGETGVDEQSSYLFQYQDGRQAVLSASCRTNGNREAIICGPKGKLVIHAPWWKARTGTVHLNNGESQEIAMPYDGLGYQFEAAHVMNCLDKDLRESPIMPLDETVRIAKVMDYCRKEWGMSYPMEETSETSNAEHLT